MATWPRLTMCKQVATKDRGAEGGCVGGSDARRPGHKPYAPRYAPIMSQCVPWQQRRPRPSPAHLIDRLLRSNGGLFSSPAREPCSRPYGGPLPSCVQHNTAQQQWTSTHSVQQSVWRMASPREGCLWKTQGGFVRVGWKACTIAGRQRSTRAVWPATSTSRAEACVGVACGGASFVCWGPCHGRAGIQV